MLLCICRMWKKKHMFADNFIMWFYDDIVNSACYTAPRWLKSELYGHSQNNQQITALLQSLTFSPTCRMNHA